ncbi:plasma-membrane choline transporter-domain-containing protein [Paraphysoderma sedebokerense]|nr:plasma-membrane choline transporter-domain-containing protein [Paraphysoderma sedebokerense]
MNNFFSSGISPSDVPFPHLLANNVSNDDQEILGQDGDFIQNNIYNEALDIQPIASNASAPSVPTSVLSSFVASLPQIHQYDNSSAHISTSLLRDGYPASMPYQLRSDVGGVPETFAVGIPPLSSQLLNQSKENEYLQNSDYDQDLESWLPSAIYSENLNPKDSEMFEHDGDHPMLEGLLVQDNAIAVSDRFLNEASHSMFPRKDAAFALLYAFSMSVFCLLGISFWLTPAAAVSQIPRFAQICLSSFQRMLPLFSITLVVSVISGTIWIYTLRLFVKPLIWLTVLMVPLSCLSLMIWSSQQLRLIGKGDGLDGQYGETGFLAVILLSTAISGSAFTFYTYLKRHKIESAVKMVQLSCDILTDNQQIFGISFFLLGVYVGFCTVWVLVTGRFLSLWGGKSWVSDMGFTVTMIYFVLVFLWTTAIFMNIHRMTIAGIVHHWYFNRHTPGRLNPNERGKESLKRASTLLLGSVCFGSLILSAVQTVQMISYVWEKNHLTSRNQRRQSASVFCVFSSFLNFLTRIISTINHYTLIYLTFTNPPTSFCTAARHSTLLIKRNVADLMLRDIFTRGILLLGNFVLSLSGGMVAWMIGAYSIEALNKGIDVGSNSVLFWFGVGGISIGYFVGRYFSDVIINIMDSTFVCYAIDLDTNKCHSNRAHQIFGGSITKY